MEDDSDGYSEMEDDIASDSGTNDNIDGGFDETNILP